MAPNHIMLQSGLPSAGGVLALVILILLVVIWLLRRSGAIPGMVKGNHILSVKYNQPLGPRGRLVVVEIDDKWFLLGVTADNISCLASMGKQTDGDDRSSTPADGNFQIALLNSLRKRNTGNKK